MTEDTTSPQIDPHEALRDFGEHLAAMHAKYGGGQGQPGQAAGAAPQQGGQNSAAQAALLRMMGGGAQQNVQGPGNPGTSGTERFFQMMIAGRQAGNQFALERRSELEH